MTGWRGLLFTCVLALLLAGPAQGRKKHDPCRPKHATTEFDNGRIRLYLVPTEDGNAEYLCVWRTRKRFKLAEGSGQDATGDEVNGFLTTGRFFLYVASPIGRPEFGRGTVKLLDFRSGRRRVPPLNAWPVDWALSGSGTIAYTTDPSQGAPRAVYALPLDAAQPEQLDVGEDIDPSSLVRWGHTLYWSRGGETRSAQIP